MPYMATSLWNGVVITMVEITLRDGRTFTSSVKIADAIRNWNDAQGFGIPFKVSDSLWVSGEQIIQIELKDN
jgi:hypothetical protein